MLFLRFFWFLLWPLRLPFFLLGRAARALRPARAGANAEAGRAAEALAAGAASRVGSKNVYYETRRSGLFKVLKVEESDEVRIDDSGTDAARQLEIANRLAANARQYYSKRPPLFPGIPEDGEVDPHESANPYASAALTRDFYEEVENGFLEEVTRIDNAGAEDQFMRMLTAGRRVANDNARTLFCELAPLVLLVLLLWHSVIMIFDPFHLIKAGESASTLEHYLREGAAGIALAGGALGVAIIFVALLYQLSYTHIQRQNAFDLNAFIQTEFSRLNGSFKAAFRECLQAETRLDNTQHDRVGPIASAWALSYHWIGVRQLVEELAIRNAMFQIRRNTSLYMTGGACICLILGGLIAAGYLLASIWLRAAAPTYIALGHIAGITALFTLVAYGIAMRRPFALIASRFRKNQWDRLDTLAIGESISEQVSRDKLQIVIQRDTRR